MEWNRMVVLANSIKKGGRCEKDKTPQENHATYAPGLILSRWIPSSYSPCLPAFSLRTSSSPVRMNTELESSTMSACPRRAAGTRNDIGGGETDGIFIP